MGRCFSYSQPSSSSIPYAGSYGIPSDGEVSSRPARCAGGRGIPDRCYCGLVPVIQTSNTVMNPSRRFFGCRNGQDGGYHVFKWCDEAMMESLKDLKVIVECEITEVKEVLETMNANKAKMETEILHLKEAISDKRLSTLPEIMNVSVCVLILICGIIFFVFA